MAREELPLPEGTLSDVPLYDLSVRKRSAAIVTAATYGPFFLSVVAVWLFAALLDPNTEDPMLDLTIILCSFCPSTLLMFALPRFLPFLLTRSYRKVIQPKCENSLGRDLSGSVHVGFSPGEERQDFGGDDAEDIGFLVLEDGVMEYYGDTWSFGLLAEQVQSVAITKYPSFFHPSCRIYVTWVGVASDQQVFTLEVRDARSVWDLASRTRRLYNDIEAWLGTTDAFDSKYIARSAPYHKAADGKIIVSQGTRLITMDLGPGKVFLAADGHRRVEDLMEYLSREAPEIVVETFDEALRNTIAIFFREGIAKPSDLGGYDLMIKSMVAQLSTQGMIRLLDSPSDPS